MRLRGRKFGQVAVYGAASGGGTPFGISFIGTANNTTTASSFTFTAQAIGTADATRIVAVGVAHGINGGISVSSVTIGGNAATFATSSRGDSTNGSGSEIWYLAVPIGTTANIVVNLSGSQLRCAIDVYSIVGTGSAFSVAGNSGSNVGTNTASVTASVPTGGGAIGILNLHGASSAGTVTNGANLTSIDQNGVLVAATSTVLGAGHNTSASGSTAFTFNFTSASDFAMSLATFAP